MARRRRRQPAAVIQTGTGRTITTTAPRPAGGTRGAFAHTPAPAPHKVLPGGPVLPHTVHVGAFPGLVAHPTYPMGAATGGTATSVATQPGAVTQPGTDQFGNPTGPGSSADRASGTTQGGQPNLGNQQAGGPGAGPPQDHSQELGFAGLPPDVAANVDAIFRQYPHDQNAAAQAALAYIRGTDWYKATFPGIDLARANGFIGTGIGSEDQYRQYYNQYNQLYNQYYGRNMTSAEAINLFGGAVDPSYLGKQFYGAAYYRANATDLNYLAGAFSEVGQGKGGTLSAQQGQAYGQEVAGIDTPLGQILQQKLDLAGKRLQAVFGGTAATPNLNQGVAGVAAPSLLGVRQTPDVAS